MSCRVWKHARRSPNTSRSTRFRPRRRKRPSSGDGGRHGFSRMCDVCARRCRMHIPMVLSRGSNWTGRSSLQLKRNAGYPPKRHGWPPTLGRLRDPAPPSEACFHRLHDEPATLMIAHCSTPERWSARRDPADADHRGRNRGAQPGTLTHRLTPVRRRWPDRSPL